MSKYRKPFLTLLRKHWMNRFPSWPLMTGAPGDRFPKDSSFTYRGDETTPHAFHALVEFSPKWTGTFTCDLIVDQKDSPFAGPPHPRLPADIPFLKPGVYRIGWFMQGQDVWWRLADDAAEALNFYSQFPGVDASAMGTERHPHHWYASRYDCSLAETLEEAAVNFCDVFQKYVLPKLQASS